LSGAALSGWMVRARTVRALGVGNVLDVAVYRAGLRAGVHPAQRLPVVAPIVGPFFAGSANTDAGFTAPGAWSDGHRYFGWFNVPDTRVPDWFRNPFTKARVRNPDSPWHTFGDFDPDLGDIKTIWEASRFDWVLAFAQAARAGETRAVTRLNEWLTDWFAKNPPYQGPNWMCGQEASIRLMHIAMAALILGRATAPSPAVVALVEAHLQRIAPTMSYARAQNNNHGTSEAAALFIGGTWLEIVGHKRGAAIADVGRAALEERGLSLIEPDGSFSQYSVTYHRVMLDTFAMAEVWRRHVGQEPFSPALQQRLAAATLWLAALTDPVGGDAPNIGHNDGANLLPLTDADNRDFRPSVQLAASLFLDANAYPGDENSQRHLDWLGVAAGAGPMPTPQFSRFDNGGLAVLRNGSAMAVLRYPRHRFRPSHADALHLDFWLGGVNLLRDGGTFSYADAGAMDHFPTVAAHNTVQFDSRDQMPRLGRFLYGDWTQADRVTPIAHEGDTITTSASYRDRRGASHERRVQLRPGQLDVSDRVAGFASRAVLRWRLVPGPWMLDGRTATDGLRSLSVDASVPIVRCEIVQGRESRYYMKESTLPVLEVEIAKPGEYSTTVRWS
jgi:hypothetical protein